MADDDLKITCYDMGTCVLKDLAERMSKATAMKLLRDDFALLEEKAEKLVDATTAFDAHPELNRWRDISCLERTRVPLKGGNGYIHANFVDGYRTPRKFICTQGPLEHTIADFYHMIWEQNCGVVVALTRLGGQRCTLYFAPAAGGSKRYGEFKVTTATVRQLDGFDAVTLVLRLRKKERTVLQFTYYAWPDKGTPTDSLALLKFLEHVNFNAAHPDLAQRTSHPIVVHCSAGIGRTGTLVALDILARRLDASVEKGEARVVDPFHTVYYLRYQRMSMVQKAEQYIFLHMAVLEFALARRLLPPGTVDLANFFKTVRSTMTQIALSEH